VWCGFDGVICVLEPRATRGAGGNGDSHPLITHEKMFELLIMVQLFL